MKVAIVQITDRCNYHCLGCNPINKRHANMNIILDSIKNSGCKIISLTGGEPYLYPNLCDIVNEIKDMHKIVHIATNGSFPNMIDKIKPHILSISIDDCIAYKHNEYRNNSFAFDKAIASIKIARKLKIPTFANCLVGFWNYKKIPIIAEWINKNLHVPLTICYPSNEGYIYNNIPIATNEQISMAYLDISCDKNNWYGNSREYFKNAYLYSKGFRNITSCSAGKKVFYIDMDGKKKACFLKDKYTENCQDCFIECFREVNMMSLNSKFKLISTLIRMIV